MPKNENSPDALANLDEFQGSYPPVVLVAGPMDDGPAGGKHGDTPRRFVVQAMTSFFRLMRFSTIGLTDLIPWGGHPQDVADLQDDRTRNILAPVSRFADALVLTAGWESDPTSQFLLAHARELGCPAFHEDDIDDLVGRYRDHEEVEDIVELDNARGEIGVMRVDGRSIVAPKVQLDRLSRLCREITDMAAAS